MLEVGPIEILIRGFREFCDGLVLGFSNNLVDVLVVAYIGFGIRRGFFYELLDGFTQFFVVFQDCLVFIEETVQLVHEQPSKFPVLKLNIFLIVRIKIIFNI